VTGRPTLATSRTTDFLYWPPKSPDNRRQYYFLVSNAEAFVFGAMHVTLSFFSDCDCPVRRLHRTCSYLYRVHFTFHQPVPRFEPCFFKAVDQASLPPPFIHMPPLIIAFLAAAATGTAIFGFFRSTKTDDKRDSSSESPPRSTSTTPRPYPTSPHDSYSRGHTNTRVPATPDERHDSYQSPSRTPTYAGDSHRPSSTSTHAQPSYLQPQSSTRIARAAAETKPEVNRSTRDYDHPAYRSVPVSPYAGQSSATLGTSARTHASHSPQLSSTRVGQTEVSTTTTSGYGNGVHRTSLASRYAGEAGQTPTTSTRAQASYLQLPTQTCVTEVTANTQASPPTSHYDDYGYRSSFASSRATELRETSATSAARTHVSHQSQLTSIRVSQGRASTTTTADHFHVHRSSLAPPYSEESPLTGLPSPTRASHHRAPSLDASRPHVVGYFDTPSTHSRTHSSSSGSEYLGPTSSTRRVPRSPGPLLDAQYSVGFESAATAQDMQAAIALRERARRNKREMHEARDLAKGARKRGDHTTEQTHRQDAIAHESEMKSLDKRAAKIIFRENNNVKVRDHLSLCRRHAQPRL